MVAHSSERAISDSEGDASQVETQKRKHSVHADFRKNRKRSILRAEKYGDLITAEHKVFNEGRESRNNHRYAAVVQVLATLWNPCQTKTSQETEKNSRKFLEPSQKPKVVHVYNSLEFGKSCEVSLESSNNYPSAIRDKRNCRTSCTSNYRSDISHFCCNLDWMISDGRILWNAIAVFEMTKTSRQTGNLKMNEDLGNPSWTCFVRGRNLGRRFADC